MQSYCDKIIHAGVLVTQNAGRDVLSNASICVAGSKIVEIGSTGQILQKWHAPEILDYGRHLVLPGLVNAHTHAAMTFLRGLAEDQPLLAWLNETVFPLEAQLTPQIVQLGSLLGFAEMLASGITACMDMYLFEESVFAAAAQAGIRCMGGEVIFEFPSAAFANWQEALEKTCELADQYKNHDRIKVAINPHSVYTTTPEILKACAEAARSCHVPIHIHLAETRQESRLCQERHGCRPVEWLKRNDIFVHPVIAAHMVDLTPDEMKFLQNTQVVAVHNPSSNLKLGSGEAPVTELHELRIPVALGTDGAASNNSLNLFSEMKLAGLIQKNRKSNPAAISAQTILDMGTVAGARIFSEDDLGQLEVGRKADLIAMNLKLPHMQPMHDPVSQLVYAANGSECVMTMVDGEILYRDGNFARFDIEEIYKELESIYRFVSQNGKKLEDSTL